MAAAETRVDHHLARSVGPERVAVTDLTGPSPIGASPLGPDPRQAPPTTRLIGLGAMRERLRQSADPVEVFTSVAEICADMGYECTVILTDLQGPVHRIDRPDAAGVVAPSSDSLLSLLDLTPLLVLVHDTVGVSILTSDLRGGLLSRATRGQPTYADALVLRLLVDEAILVLTRERLQQELAEEREHAANLEQALASNREIGMALGFVMASQGCDAQTAFERLRSISQRTNIKLRDIAAEVVRSATAPAAPAAAAAAGATGADPQGTSSRRERGSTRKLSAPSAATPAPPPAPPAEAAEPE